jgi:hypothetical protein
MSITQPERVSVALIIQHAMRMRQLSSVACPALQHFPTFSKKGAIFEKYVLMSSTTFA